MVTAYLALLGLVGLERVAELLVSSRNARIARGRGAVEVGAQHFGPMAALHALFLPACAAEVLLLGRAFPGPLGWAALGAVALAQGLRWWAVASLGWRWSVRIIVIPGAPPMTSGPYRFARHPNYVAVAVEMLCLPLAHGAWIAAAAFSLANAAVLAVRIRAEERALGAPWAKAFAGVPRFFVGGPRG